jgi:hypothetical protein
VPADLLGAVAGLVAAATWGAGDFGAGMATKRLPAMVVLLGSQLVGLAGALLPPTRRGPRWQRSSGQSG